MPCRDGPEADRGTGRMIVRPIAGGVEVLAPAKLNLFLEVLGRRPDGYHEIESLMVAVDLYDTLTFADDPSGAITPAVRRPDACRPGARTWWSRRPSVSRPRRAVLAGRAIELHKAIPAQAGLAGGSSDAAATLVALDRLWDLRTPPERLDALAGEIGSDVAFFLHGPGGGLPRPGRAGGAGDPAGSPCTSCWSVRRSA